MKKILYSIFIGLIFFPYISIISTDTDLQPWAALLAFILFFTFRTNFTKMDLTLGIVMAISLIIFILGDKQFMAARSLAGYLSLFFISYVSFRILKTERLDIFKIIKIAIVIWIFVGIVQVLFDKSFLTFLLPDYRTSSNRGVVGLAPEPSFYGVVLLFFMLYLSHSKTPDKKKYMASCIAGVVFLSQSSMVILILSGFILLMGLIYLRFRYILLLLTPIFLMPILVSVVDYDSRTIHVLHTIVSDPVLLMTVDASVNDRMSHIIFSVKGLFEGYFFPNGFSSWSKYAEGQIFTYSDFVMVETFSLWGRIMSGYGAAFFELGVFGLLIPFLLTWLYWRLYCNDLRKFLIYSLGVNSMMMSSIQIGLPLFAFYMAFLQFQIWQSKNINIVYNYN